jgi:DNA-binding GntR family transcriptional regulator
MGDKLRDRRKANSPVRGGAAAMGPSRRTLRPEHRARERAEHAAHPLFNRRPPLQQSGESLGDFAYRVLRDALRSGRFRPHEHLREADVAGWLSISRTPVREAFHRMISEGLLVNGPWNGVMFTELSAQQLIELYAVRESLEGTAAALAAVHATAAEVQLMDRIAAKEAREGADPDRLVNINGELHQSFYKASHNRYLLQSITSVVDALGLLRHSTFVLPGSAELAHREHLEIIDAIRSRNPGEAERLARAHVRHALAMRLKLSGRA